MALVCECQLIDFSGRAGYGPWLKVRVENPESLVGFAAGQRFHLLLVAIGDDDVPATANPEARKPYKLSQLAGMMCADAEFRAFIGATYGEPCHDKDDAAQWVREACGVESRSFLDSNQEAGETFKTILQSFDEWKQQREGGG
jgi:hypothetical protein